MMKRALFTVSAILLLLSACTYRFADPFPAASYDLVAVKNSTAEPGLGRLLEEEVLRSGGFTKGSPRRLSIAVVGFKQQVETVSSEGVPVRQSLTMEISWKVEGERVSEAVFGMEEARELFLHSTDPAREEWNRRAAMRVLARKTADLLLERLEERR